MLQYLPNVTLGNLRIRTHRAKNILMLFGEKGVGIDRIKLVTCSASDISRLTNTQIQNIIDRHILHAYNIFYIEEKKFEDLQLELLTMDRYH
ncbi:hypothetical protein RclHR1_02020012 [Rhizophagus clarus]|uniref:Uncharacterized protein n=1 Tax=Rhizophagus clarus TaxID=94130 RepID=A0A2Z6QR40_9GLOM|nr:hypothetical protein RclHR1_02020012 [Rhizophagus clarus]GES87336.1 hypothetical protein GLOIN_2v1779307 [Rhizophagus clarus]